MKRGLEDEADGDADWALDSLGPVEPPHSSLLSTCALLTAEQRALLASAGLNTAESLLAAHAAGELSGRGLSEEDVAEVLPAVLVWYGGLETNVYASVGTLGPRAIDTGQADFNALLGDEGLPAGRLVELVGPAAVGKTQLCLWLAVRVALTHPTRAVLFVSSSNAVSAERMLSFLPGDMDLASARALLARIHVVNCFDFEQLMATLTQLREDVQWAGHGAPSSATSPLGPIATLHPALVVVDSVAPLLQPTLGKLPLGYSLLFAIRATLLDVGRACGCALIITNITTTGASFASGAAQTDHQLKSAMGRSWDLVANLRIWMAVDEVDPDDAVVLTVQGLGYRYDQRACVMRMLSHGLTFTPRRAIK